MSTATATAEGVRLTQMPKVNLLPAGDRGRGHVPQAAHRPRASVVAAAVGVVGLLWYSAHTQVAGAQSRARRCAADADAAPGRDDQVRRRAQDLRRPSTAAEAQLNLAMGHEVRFSFVLNDLSMTIPDKVWLNTATITQDVDGTSPPDRCLGQHRVSPP